MVCHKDQNPESKMVDQISDSKCARQTWKTCKNNTLFSCFQAPHPKKDIESVPSRQNREKKTWDPWDWNICTCMNGWIFNGKLDYWDPFSSGTSPTSLLIKGTLHACPSLDCVGKLEKAIPGIPGFFDQPTSTIIGFFESLGIHVTGFHWGFWIFHVTVFWIFHGCHVTWGDL